LALTWIAASRLTGPGYHAVSLGVGVPLAWYASQHDALAQALTQTVRLENGHGTTLTVIDATVFPQGIGALAKQDDLPRNALIGLVDIGYRTVDYLLAETDADGIPVPILDRSGTYSGGVHQAYQNLAQVIETETGTHWEPHELVDRDQITAHGRVLGLADRRNRAIADLSQAIQTHLAAQWDGLIDRLDVLYLAGGGAMALQAAQPWAGAQLIDSPQWANAQGFLTLLGAY
jgi:plasmid segregation protein ParM